jgi:hypothetical protein
MQPGRRLHATVQGVETIVRVERRDVRVVVSRSVFEVHFGATDDPQSWLRAFDANAAAIREAVRRKAQAHPQLDALVLLEGDVDPHKPPRRAGPAAPAKPRRAA